MITQRPIGEYCSSDSPIAVRIKPFQSQVAVHETQGIVIKVYFNSDVWTLSALSENIRFPAVVIDICADVLASLLAQETTDSSDLGLYRANPNADITERSWNRSNSFHLRHRSFLMASLQTSM